MKILLSKTDKWIVALALIGFASALGSSYVHFQLLVDPGYSSFCDINSSISCTHLYQSRFGSVYGIPVALGGVFWFIGVLLLVIVGAKAPKESHENIAAYLIIWSTLGLAAAMYMAYASFIVLQTFCFFCGVVYVTVVGIFFLSEREEATPLSRIPRMLPQDLYRLIRRPIGFGITFIFLVGALSSILWFPYLQLLKTKPVVSTSSVEENFDFDQWWIQQPRIEVPVSVENASVLVIKFNDYQCPACAETFRLYESIFEKYESSHPGAVKLVVMDYPLDPKCNNQAPNGLHDSACEAAVSVRIARHVGESEAEEMTRWLYNNQQVMSPTTIKAAILEIAGVKNFDALYPEVVEEVKNDVAVAATVQVKATPTFILNGVLLQGGLTPTFFERAIAYELDR